MDPIHVDNQPRSGRLNSRVAIVTGSTSGIGAATARRLAGEGALVVVTGREEQISLKRIGTSEDCANAIAFLASDGERFIIATPLLVDGGAVFG